MSEHSFPAIWLMFQCYSFLIFSIVFMAMVWIGDAVMLPFAIGAGVLCIASGITWLILVRKS